MVRIAVVGVVAIGGAVAAPLAASGAHELVLCVRALFASLVLQSPAGRFDLSARNGAVVRIGARHGIATPLNAAVCALLEASVDSAPGGER